MEAVKESKPFDLQEYLNPRKSQRKVSASLDGGSMSSEVEEEGSKALFKQKTLGKQDFLNLLVTQLKYQDPLEPPENTEFVAQLAQFSSLENSQNVSDSMDKLKEKIEGLVQRQQEAASLVGNSSATSLIGRDLKLKTTSLSYDHSKGREVEIPVHAETGGAILTIADKDGKLVRALELKERGDGMVEWDGMDAQGQPAPAGRYVVRVSSADGTREAGYAWRQERVSGIRYTPEGLRLQGAKGEYKMEEVLEVREAQGT